MPRPRAHPHAHLRACPHAHPRARPRSRLSCPLTGELFSLAGGLDAAAAAAAVVEAAELEGGAAISQRIGRKHHRRSAAPPWDHFQQPSAAQQTHLQRTCGDTVESGSTMLDWIIFTIHS